MSTDDLPLLLTVDEARALLRVGRPAMYEALRQGLIPHHKIGSQYRIPKNRLLEWMESPKETGA